MQSFLVLLLKRDTDKSETNKRSLWQGCCIVEPRCSQFNTEKSLLNRRSLESQSSATKNHTSTSPPIISENMDRVQSAPYAQSLIPTAK